MDYYGTLGVSQNATPEEIKKAYRKQAMKHHPDRNNGDDTKFKQVQAAYDVLSDPQKRQMVDMGADPNQQHQGGGFNRGPFEFHFGNAPPGFEDVFSNFGFGGQRQRRKNQTVSLNLAISLEDAFSGKDLDAEVNFPNSGKKIVGISVPPGINSGQQIKYSGIGDQRFTDLPPGDLIVYVHVVDHPEFKRDGDNLILNKRITCWDAILGTTALIKTINGKKLNINIPKGTQPDTVLSCKGEGMPNIRNGRRGNLLVKISVDIPKDLTHTQYQSIQDIKEGK